MKPNPVVWFEIYVQDMDRARKFYEGTLGVKLEALPMPDGPECENKEMGEMEMFVFPRDTEDKPGATGTLVKMDGVPSGGNSTMVYFACEDCAVEEARAKTSGGSVFKSKMPIGPHGFIAIIKDTEGNRVGLHSMK